MAYRATTRKVTKPKKTSDTSVSEVPSSSEVPKEEKEVVDQFVTPPSDEAPSQSRGEEMSIDDILGTPSNPPSASTTPQPATPSQTRTNDNQPERYPSNQGYQDRGQQRGYSQGGGYRRSYSNQPRYNEGGYGGQNQGQGYRRPYSGQGRYNEGTGYNGGTFRRPQTRDISETQNGTPDITVPTELVKGVLDMMPEGHGFLRPKFTPSERDVYISQSQIRRFLLRNGDEVEGQGRQPKDNERYWGLLKVEKVNGAEADSISNRPKFEDLVPLYPNKVLKLETGQQPYSTRIIDLIAPIGFGQRGLIVSPPKAGKTTILKEIAAGITANYPEVHLMAALIGERPEEVTDLTRSIKGEVLASNFDQSPAEQVRVAEVALDRAKRLVEMGKDVVILLDSITRLARAYNLVVNPSGRTLSGGFDPAALYPAKKFLGAARCVEAPEGSTKDIGGSLTVLGTALVETGSRMDDLIYEEFKGTGNMELHLSRKLQERRIFPAIDVTTSGTRHDELLLGEETMKRVVTLRHMLTLLSDEEQTSMLIEKLGKVETNNEFLESLNQG